MAGGATVEAAFAPVGIGGKVAVDVFAALEYLASISRANIPSIQDEITVEVVGQPGSSKQELYFLALAAANGIVKRLGPLLQLNPFLPPSMGSLMIEYDAADHWVRCTMMYRMAAIAGGIASDTSVATVIKSVTTSPKSAFDFIAKGGVGGIIVKEITAAFYDSLAIYRGPQCEVVGGKFDFVDGGTMDPSPFFAIGGGIIPGIPSATSGNAPTLPWAGRTILTQCAETVDPAPIPPITQPPPPSSKKLPGQKIKSPNPKPVGDNRSRGAVVTASKTGELGTSSSLTSSSRKCCDKELSIVELVYASLTNPGSFAGELWVEPVQGPKGD